MPTYEYRCKDCGEDLEVIQAFSDDALTTCLTCGGSLKKVFGSVGISFKGSGFYKTDSRGSTKSTATANGDSSSSSESSSTTASSESSSSSDSKATKSSSDPKPSSSGSDTKASTPKAAAPA